MGLFHIFGLTPPKDSLPPFIRAVEDIRGVRVLRLHGPVGAEIAPQVDAADEYARATEAFGRPLLLDFKDTTGCDFATVAFLVRALRRRLAARAAVGIVNAPPYLVSELEIAKLQGLFRVFGSESEALAALAPA